MIEYLESCGQLNFSRCDEENRNRLGVPEVSQSRKAEAEGRRQKQKAEGRRQKAEGRRQEAGSRRGILAADLRG